VGSLLALSGINKRFGRLAVLRGVDLDVDAGTIVGLIGANGAGKTTLLSIVAGLVPATSGGRRFAEFDSGEVGPQERARLALVTHTAQMYGRLTARENLQLFADLRLCANAPTADPLPLLERLGLGHAVDRQAGTFSRGMLQRLALARALLGRPELLLLDEPFTALDRSGRELLAQVLQEERDRGTAILLSSHDFDALLSVCDRVVLLEHGTIAGTARRDATDPSGDAYRRQVQALAGHMLPRQAADA
jgi:ABC-type multidrug transport system ATPase subunit